ncbi:hypothetical protein M9H77_22684 [Catharanthus roseus]|uniref:Uncharacterized protein n=1 Tax=Catharanthus roseus TaxID=4058 RepID=A0ACC0AV79_CATRO|nr:hypothetical protein M9H77_22684 [Catharanthus roseus]
MEPSTVKEPPKVIELSQAKIEESLKIHVVEGTSKEEPCYIMCENSIEIKEKERVEEKTRLNVQKKKRVSLKSEIVKEDECFIEKQESEKEEQREKETVVFEKSKENFEDSSKNEGGTLAYKNRRQRNMEKELGAILEKLPISLSLNLSLSFNKELSHVLRLDGKTNMKLIKYIHSKNHGIVHANNKKFGLQHLVFDPRGLISNTFGFK